MLPLTMFSHVASGETYKIVVGAWQDDDDGYSSGSVYVYDLDGTNQVKITASDGATYDYFGSSVAAGNDKIVVGAHEDDDNGSNSGSAYVYDLDGTNQVKITASDGASNDEFGTSVAVGSDQIVIGAPYDDPSGSNSGSAYIYDLDGTNEVKITPSVGYNSEYYGSSVAVGDEKVVVGVPRGWSQNPGWIFNAGLVYIYDLDGTNEVKITPSDSSQGMQFGKSVAVGNNKIVGGTNINSVYVYDLDGTNEVKITPSDGAIEDYFGVSVAVGNDKIVVGAPEDDDDGSASGAVYVYDLDGTNEVKITASDGASYDNFGSSVAVKGDKIVVGAYRDDDNYSSSGSVYVYDLDGTNEVKITASDGGTSDEFGRRVAIG